MAKNVPVTFKSGASGATYSGKIKGYNTDSYTFYAKKGQVISTDITGNVQTYLVGTGLDEPIDLADRPNYELLANGKYTIKISQMRAMARQGKTTNYTLQITIR